MSSAETAQRLAAHPRWTWREGMRVIQPETEPTLAPYRFDEDWIEDDFEDGDDDGGRVGWPDLDDPATQGVLRAMLRAAVAGPLDIDDEPAADGLPGLVWVRRWHSRPQTIGYAATYGEALALALLAAWGEEVGDE